MNTTTRAIAESNRSRSGESQENNVVLRFNFNRIETQPNLSKKLTLKPRKTKDW